MRSRIWDVVVIALLLAACQSQTPAQPTQRLAQPTAPPPPHPTLIAQAAPDPLPSAPTQPPAAPELPTSGPTQPPAIPPTTPSPPTETQPERTIALSVDLRAADGTRAVLSLESADDRRMVATWSPCGAVEHTISVGTYAFYLRWSTSAPQRQDLAAPTSDELRLDLDTPMYAVIPGNGQAQPDILLLMQPGGCVGTVAYAYALAPDGARLQRLHVDATRLERIDQYVVRPFDQELDAMYVGIDTTFQPLGSGRFTSQLYNRAVGGVVRYTWELDAASATLVAVAAERQP
jgi:hypothetical protein